MRVRREIVLAAALALLILFAATTSLQPQFYENFFSGSALVSLPSGNSGENAQDSASFAGESCTTAADCAAGEACVAGVCGTCGASNAGQQCSDDALNPYTNDGVCTFDRQCQESVVCKHPVLSQPFRGCTTCGSGASCDTNPAGGISYDGVCLGARCFTEYCSSSNDLAPESCGSLAIACSALNEGKSCDDVSDASFTPDAKICSSGQCVVAQQPSPQQPSAPQVS